MIALHFFFGYVGGIKRKNFKDPDKKKIEELQTKLNDKDEENHILKRRIVEFEDIAKA